jgi:transglutaminase-like putative cysteine protease
MEPAKLIGVVVATVILIIVLAIVSFYIHPQAPQEKQWTYSLISEQKIGEDTYERIYEIHFNLGRSPTSKEIIAISSQIIKEIEDQNPHMEVLVGSYELLSLDPARFKFAYRISGRSAGGSYDRSPSLGSTAMKQYITPNDPLVQATLDSILRDKPWYRTDYEVIKNWVVDHISYRYDREAYGVPDYWQFPSETIRLGHGDCEDFALLLCSLLRAAGWPAEDVFVILGIGRFEEVGHAYLTTRRTGSEAYSVKDYWMMAEPQASGLVEGTLANLLNLIQFREVCYFNDKLILTELPEA